VDKAEVLECLRRGGKMQVRVSCPSRLTSALSIGFRRLGVPHIFTWGQRRRRFPKS